MTTNFKIQKEFRVQNIVVNNLWVPMGHPITYFENVINVFSLQFLGTCKTTFDVENKRKGVDCIFPFYRPKDGRTYNGCILSSGNSYWCTTKGIILIK